MIRYGRFVHLLLLASLILATAFPATSALAQSRPPASERWRYLFLVISEEDEFILLRPSTTTSEDEAMDEAISHVRTKYGDGWDELHIINRIAIYMSVIGSWGWEVVPLELPYTPLTQEVIVFKRQG